MRLAALLLALVALTHYGYPVLAAGHADPDQAGRIIFYVLRGIEGAALFLLVGICVGRPVVWLVCVWGAIEESLTAGCQMAVGVETAKSEGAFEGICGNGWYTLGLVAAAVIAAYLLDKIRGQNGLAR